MDKVHFGLGMFFGMIIGAAGTYLFMRDSIDQELTEATENIREYYKNKYINEQPSEEAKEETKEEFVTPKEYEELVKTFDYSSFSTAKIMNEPKDDDDGWEDVDEEDNPFAEGTVPLKDDGLEEKIYPYAITQEQFDTTCRGYFKEDYTFYADENRMVDRRNKSVDMSSISSDEVLQLLSNPKTSEVFVRNDMLQMDFDIVIDRSLA